MRAENFSLLLYVLRTELSLDWGFYQEFLDEVKAAIVTGRRFSVWAEQIEPLVRSLACQFAHEGVLFLLREMEVRVRKEGMDLVMVGLTFTQAALIASSSS